MAADSGNQLESQIEVLRMRMQNLWRERGYIDEAVLRISMELDQLLNEYQRLWKQNASCQK